MTSHAVAASARPQSAPANAGADRILERRFMVITDPSGFRPVRFARRVALRLDRRHPRAILVRSRGGLVSQELDRPPAGEMLRGDPSGAVDRHGAVPDRLRVNDDHRPVAALIEATGLVHPDGPLQPARGDFFLENPVHVQRAVERAVFAAGADEQMTLVLAHLGLLRAPDRLPGSENYHTGRSPHNAPLDRDAPSGYTALAREGGCRRATPPRRFSGHAAGCRSSRCRTWSSFRT